MEPAVTSFGALAFLAEMLAPLVLCSSIPVGSPPVPDPALGRIAPAECMFYIGWAGLGVPDPKSPNRAERFLADPEIRQMREEAARRFRLLCKSGSDVLKSTPIGTYVDLVSTTSRGDASDVITWSELLVTRPCAMFVRRREIQGESATPLFDGALVINVGDAQKQVASILKRYRETAAGEISEETIGESLEYRVDDDQSPVRWGLRGDYFILTWGQETPSVVAQRLAGAEPAWFAAIAEQLPVERRAAVVSLDAEAILKAAGEEVRSQAGVVGLGGLHRVTLVTGLDREEFVSRLAIEADPETAARWRAMVARPVQLEDLKVVPQDATLALAVNLDPRQLVAMLSSLQKQVAHDDPVPESGPGHDASNAVMSAVAGDLTTALGTAAAMCVREPDLKIDAGLCEELAASLGSTWRLYASPGEGALVLLNLTAVVRVKDRDRLVRAFDAMAARTTSEKDEPAAAPGRLHARKVQFAGHDVYLFRRQGSDSARFLACCVAGDELVCSPSPQGVKAYLLRPAGRPSLDREPTVQESLGAKPAPALICYEDSREMFRLTYPLIQFGVNALATRAGLHAGGPDPMLLPAASTVAQYLRPAVSTVTPTDRGLEIEIHQSLPNGNLGAMVYLAVCSSLPEDVAAWTGTGSPPAASAGASSPAATVETQTEKPKAPKFTTFTEKQGPCAIDIREDQPNKETIELGTNILADCRFYRQIFFDQTIVNANISVKNASKERRTCHYYVAFFDAKGDLVGCASQGARDDGLAPGESTSFGSCLVFLPDEQIARIASYRVRLYESDPLPDPKPDPNRGGGFFRGPALPTGTFSSSPATVSPGTAVPSTTWAPGTLQGPAIGPTTFTPIPSGSAPKTSTVPVPARSEPVKKEPGGKP